MKALLSLIVMPNLVATPFINTTVSNINKIQQVQARDDNMDIDLLRESFINFFNTILEVTKTQLSKTRNLFDESNDMVKNLLTRIDSISELKADTKSDNVIFANVTNMVNIYLQVVKITLSLDGATESSRSIMKAENYNTDNISKLYAKTMESIHTKITLFFNENINKISKFVKSDELQKLYESQVINAEVKDIMFFSITLSDIEYFLTNVIQDISKVAYENIDLFGTWYQQLEKMILSFAKHDENESPYYYVPMDDNKNLKELEQKIDQNMKNAEEHINNHLNIGKQKEFLNVVGNSFTRIEKKLSDKVNYTYEAKIEISVRKKILDNSSIKAINLPSIKIFANGTFAKDKLDQKAENSKKINNMQSDKNNYIQKEKLADKLKNRTEYRTYLYTIVTPKNDSHNSYKNFELNELKISCDIYIHWMGGTIQELVTTLTKDDIKHEKDSAIQELEEGFKNGSIGSLLFSVSASYDRLKDNTSEIKWRWQVCIERGHSNNYFLLVAVERSKTLNFYAHASAVVDWLSYEFEYSYESDINLVESELKELKDKNEFLQQQIDKIANTFSNKT